MSYTERKAWPGASVTRTVEPTPPAPEEVAPRGMSAARAKAPPPKPVPVCSYCSTPGGRGKAVVCGASIACPVCTGPGWAGLAAKYGAESALGGEAMRMFKDVEGKEEAQPGDPVARIEAEPPPGTQERPPCACKGGARCVVHFAQEKYGMTRDQAVAWFFGDDEDE